MKKFLCIVLSILCIFSMFSMTISAAEVNAKHYIVYLAQPNAAIKFTYMPAPLVVETPQNVFITESVPVADGYNFHYWVDKNGATYQPGEEVSLVGILELYAVMAKENNGEEEETKIYSISYEMQPASQVKLLYKPIASISFDGTGYVTVTKDSPIAIDHNFVCWKDENGKLYYEGDKVLVDGEVVLYPVWEEKHDRLPTPIRAILATIVMINRVLTKALGIFKDIQEFEAATTETTVVDPTV